MKRNMAWMAALATLLWVAGTAAWADGNGFGRGMPVQSVPWAKGAERGFSTGSRVPGTAAVRQTVASEVEPERKVKVELRCRLLHDMPRAGTGEGRLPQAATESTKHYHVFVFDARTGQLLANTGWIGEEKGRGRSFDDAANLGTYGREAVYTLETTWGGYRNAADGYAELTKDNRYEALNGADELTDEIRLQFARQYLAGLLDGKEKSEALVSAAWTAVRRAVDQARGEEGRPEEAPQSASIEDARLDKCVPGDDCRLWAVQFFLFMRTAAERAVKAVPAATGASAPSSGTSGAGVPSRGFRTPVASASDAPRVPFASGTPAVSSPSGRSGGAFRTSPGSSEGSVARSPFASGKPVVSPSASPSSSGGGFRMPAGTPATALPEEPAAAETLPASDDSGTTGESEASDASEPPADDTATTGGSGEAEEAGVATDVTSEASEATSPAAEPDVPASNDQDVAPEEAEPPPPSAEAETPSAEPVEEADGSGSDSPASVQAPVSDAPRVPAAEPTVRKAGDGDNPVGFHVKRVPMETADLGVRMARIDATTPPNGNFAYASAAMRLANRTRHHIEMCIVSFDVGGVQAQDLVFRNIPPGGEAETAIMLVGGSAVRAAMEEEAFLFPSLVLVRDADGKGVVDLYRTGETPSIGYLPLRKGEE